MFSKANGRVILRVLQASPPDGPKQQNQHRWEECDEDEDRDSSGQPAVHVSEQLLLRERTTRHWNKGIMPVNAPQELCLG